MLEHKQNKKEINKSKNKISKPNPNQLNSNLKMKSIFQFLKSKDLTPNVSLIKLNLKREYKKNPFLLIFKSFLLIFIFIKSFQLHKFLNALTIYIPQEEMNNINSIGNFNKMNSSEYEEFLDNVASKYSQMKNK